MYKTLMFQHINY